jgi:hypothetical protein
MNDVPWLDLREHAGLFNMTYASIKNAIAQGRFPVDTYKQGKTYVADKDVVSAYFSSLKERGLAKLAAPSERKDGRRRHK